MIAYNNGCSHSTHHTSNEHFQNVSSIGFELFDKLKISNFKSLGLIHRQIQPTKFFNEFNNTLLLDSFLLNVSNDGKSNDAIYFESISDIQKLIDSGKKPDYVFIQWSGPSRRLAMITRDEMRKDLLSKSEEKKDLYIQNVNLFDYNSHRPHLEPLASYITLYYIFSLQQFLKYNDIKYTFCCYMELDKTIESDYIFSKLDLNNFICFNNSTHPIFDGFRNKMIEIKKLVIDKEGHPSLYGKKFIAHIILRKLKDLYNLEYSEYNKKFIDNI